jgi:Ni/Co efflux regulator RcnB
VHKAREDNARGRARPPSEETMKSRLFSLAALLMTGAASGALAQGQPQIQNGGPMWNAARQAQAHQGQHPQGQPPQGQPPQGQPPQGQPPQHGPHGPPQGAPPARPGQPSRPGGERQNWSQPGPGQRGPDHRDGDHHDGGQRDHWDGDRRGGDHRDWSRRGDNRGPDWNRYDRGGPPPRNAPRWAPRRYPPVYSSPSRYRAPYWRPPEGFYARAWRYGEILPRGWYGPDYALFDWWSFGLPEPPPGYEWVRVGADALLVDDYGRIFQVVRAVFW